MRRVKGHAPSWRPINGVVSTAVSILAMALLGAAGMWAVRLLGR